MIEKAREYAIKHHEGTNHKYGNESYVAHLSQVVTVALNYIYLIPVHDRENVIAACWVHDIIEDCRQTYNDVRSETCKEVADIAYALTNEKGKTRAERADYRYYEGIKRTPYADFVKICDRIANAEYSAFNKSNGMLDKYKAEYIGFKNQLYMPVYDSMFTDLHQALFPETIKQTVC